MIKATKKVVRTKESEGLKLYSFPSLNRTVMATSLGDAQKKLGLIPEKQESKDE